MNGLILKESARGIDAYTPESGLLQKRMLFFREEVNAESCDRLIQYLLFLDQDDPGKEITLCINSPGGDVGSGLAAYDCMKLMKSPIRTLCTGLAASMGSILFLAGSRREMLPHSRLMIHDPLIAGLSERQMALQLKKRADELMETRQVIGEIIAGAGNLSLEEVYDMTSEDCFLTAEKSVELGLATGIVTDLW